MVLHCHSYSKRVKRGKETKKGKAIKPTPWICLFLLFPILMKRNNFVVSDNDKINGIGKSFSLLRLFDSIFCYLQTHQIFFHISLLMMFDNQWKLDFRSKARERFPFTAFGSLALPTLALHNFFYCKLFNFYDCKKKDGICTKKRFFYVLGKGKHSVRLHVRNPLPVR